MLRLETIAPGFGVLALQDHHAGVDLGASALKGRRRQADIAHLVKPLGRVTFHECVEFLIRSRAFRDQRHNAPAIAEVGRGLGDMRNRRAAARAKGRVHHDGVVFVDDVEVFKTVLLHIRARAGQDRARRQLGAGLHQRPFGGVWERARNGAVARAGLQHLIARADVRPLDHLVTDRLRRGVIIRALAAHAPGLLLALGIIERLRALEFAGALVKRAVRLFAAAPIFLARRIRRRLVEGVDERLAQRAGAIAQRQVFRSASALCQARRESVTLPIRAGVHVPENGVAGLANTIGAPFDLDGGDGTPRHTQVDQNALVLAGGVMQRNAGLASGALHHDEIMAPAIHIEFCLGFGAGLFRDCAVIDQGVGECALEGFERAAHARHIGAKLLHIGICLHKTIIGGAHIGLAQRRAGFRVHAAPHVGRVFKRIKAAAFVEVMEDHNLAAHRHVLLDHRNGVRCLDRFQEAHAGEIIEAAADGRSQFRSVLVGLAHIVQPL